MKLKKTPAEVLKSKATRKTISTSSTSPETLYETRKKLSGANDKPVVLNESAVRSVVSHSGSQKETSSKGVEASLIAASMTKMVAPTKEVMAEEVSMPEKKEFANAQGYSYAGGSYGNFVGGSGSNVYPILNTPAYEALNAALIIQTAGSTNATGDKKPKSQYVANSVSYKYYGGSYGRFVNEDETAMKAANILDSKPKYPTGNEQRVFVPGLEAKDEEKGFKYYWKKYKLLIIASVCTLVYVVVRKNKKA